MMKATTVPPSTGSNNTNARPTSPYYRGTGGSHRRRSWSEENTIREETTEDATQFLNHPAAASRNAQHASPPSFSAYNHSSDNPQTTNIGGFQVQRTTPFYMFLLLLVTIPMVFVSLLSTSRIPRPSSLDHDPRLMVPNAQLLTQQHSKLHKDDKSASQNTIQEINNPHRSLQSTYQGRTYHGTNDEHGVSYEQMTTLFETASAKCSVARPRTSSSSQQQQSPSTISDDQQVLLVSQLDQVLVAVFDSDGEEWIIPADHGTSPPKEAQPPDARAFVWQSSVQDLHEPPLAAAMRIVLGTDAARQDTVPEIALDAHGWPLGHVPETMSHEWTFLGRTQLPDRLAFAYLYQPAGGGKGDSPKPSKRETHARVRQEWQRGTMVSVSHSWAMSLALFGPKAPRVGSQIPQQYR